MAKYLGIHPRDWKHSQYKLLCGEISVLQDVKTDGDIATIQAVDWGDEYLALCTRPFSSMVTRIAPGHRVCGIFLLDCKRCPDLSGIACC